MEVLEDVRRTKFQINQYLADTQRTPTTEQEVYGRSHPARTLGDVVTSGGSKFFKMLEVVFIVKFFFGRYFIGNKSLLVWMDTIDYHIGSYIGIILVVKLYRYDTIRKILYFSFKSC